MRKPIIIVTIIALLGILYSIFLHKKSEYVAGEMRYYTAYEKHKAKEKIVAFSPTAYKNDNYNVKRIKDRAKEQIDNLEEFRIELVTMHELIYSSNNSVSDYEKHIETLKELSATIEKKQSYYERQQNDLIELNEFVVEMEQDLYSIELYAADISHVSSIINSMDSTASKYINSTKLLEFVSASRGLELIKQVAEEKERKRQQLIAQIELERELEKLRKERESNRYSTYSSFSSNSFTTNNTWSKTYDNFSDISVPVTPNYSTYDIPNYSTQYYSTNTNPNHVKVDSYIKSNGTRVESYMRTAPNSTIIDNFSTAPNLNPYTGIIGTIKNK